MKRGAHHSADQVDGISVDQIKRLMLCFAKRPPKAYFNRYASANFSNMSFSVSGLGKQRREKKPTKSGGGSGNIMSESSSTSPLVMKQLSPEWSRKSEQNAFGTDAESSDAASSDGDVGSNEDGGKPGLGDQLLDNSASMFNVKLKPINRAVFIERVRAVLPDRPDSVINSWFNQLDTDRIGLVTWSSFSAFLLFRSATIDAADAKSAEFHVNPDAPDHMPPSVARHYEPTTSMLMNHKSGDLLTGGADGVIYAWHPVTMEPRGAALSLRSYVTGMHFLEEGNKIAISCMDRSVTIVDSRTMRVVRCFAGRSIPKHFESNEVERIVEFFEKRPDHIRIERGPRVLTAPPEVPSYTSILSGVRGDGGGGRRSTSPSSGGAAGNEQKGNNNNNENDSSNSSSSTKRGASPTRLTRLGGGAVQGASARHLDRPWVQHAHGTGGGGSTVEGRRIEIEESSAIGTYLIGEAAQARSDASRRAEIHALLDLDNCPTCMCSFPYSQSPEETKGRVASGLEGTGADTSIESGAQFQPDPVLFGMPDGVIKQYNLPTNFPRATTPRASWKPHTDRVRMMRYVPEINGVLSCSDDGTFVLSHPDRRGGHKVSSSGATDIIRQFKVPNSHQGGLLGAAASGSGASLSLATANSSSSGLGAGGGGRMSMAEQMRLKLGFAPVHVPAVVSFDFCPELKMVACCAYDRYAYLYDATQDTHTARLHGMSAPAVSVAFNGIDSQVIVACADRTVRIYDTRHSDLPLQTLERPPFQQFGNVGSSGLLVHDRRIYLSSGFPVSYCSRSAGTSSPSSAAGGKFGGKTVLSGSSAAAAAAAAGSASSSPLVTRAGGGAAASSPPSASFFTGSPSSFSFPALNHHHRTNLRRRHNKGVQAFHTGGPVHTAFVDDVGVSSGVLRLFTLCPQQMMCSTLLGGDSIFALSLPSTSTGRNHNHATTACASEGCLKVVVGYDDGSVVLWVPAVGEAAARLPDHETIHSRVRCTAVCYRRSFSVKQMLILASIENSVLFLCQGEPYTLQVASSWTSPAALGPVTCMHEMGTSNSVLCGTQQGALVVLSLTNNEMEGSPMWASARVQVVPKKKKNVAINDDDQQQQQTTAETTLFEDNDFGKVESIVPYPSFGPNVYAIVHVNGDVVFWDCLHRVQLGAICIRGMPSSITHTVVKDFGNDLQLIAYTNDVGELFVRKLEFAVIGMETDGSSGLTNFSFGSGSGGGSCPQSPLTAALNAGGGGSSSSNHHQQQHKQYLDPAVAFNINSHQYSLLHPARSVGIVRNTGPSAIGGAISPAASIIAMYRAPWDEFRPHQNKSGSVAAAASAAVPDIAVNSPPQPPGTAQGGGRRKSTVVGFEDSPSFDAPNDRRRSQIGSSGSSRAEAASSSNSSRRKSTTFDDLGQQIDDSETQQTPPEHICVIVSNSSVADVSAYCFEITDGYACHVGSGGSVEWLAAPSKNDMRDCVDLDDHDDAAAMGGSGQFGFDASISISGLNPEGAETTAKSSSGGGGGGGGGGDAFGLDSLDGTPSRQQQQDGRGDARRLSEESLISPVAKDLTPPTDAAAAAAAAPGGKKANALLGSRRSVASSSLPSALVEKKITSAAGQEDAGGTGGAAAVRNMSVDDLSAAATTGTTGAGNDQQQESCFLGMNSNDPASQSRCATPNREAQEAAAAAARQVTFQQEEEEEKMLLKKKMEQQQRQREIEARVKQQQQRQQQQQQQEKKRALRKRYPAGSGSDRGEDSGVSSGGEDSYDDNGEEEEEEEEDEEELILRGDHLQKQLFHKPRPPRITHGRKTAAEIASGRRAATTNNSLSSSRQPQPPQDQRPLSLIVPRGHNDKKKKAERMTSMIRSEALEEMRQQKLAARRASSVASGGGTTTSGGDRTGETGALTPANKFMRAVRAASSAISGMKTPRSLTLSARAGYLMSPAGSVLAVGAAGAAGGDHGESSSSLLGVGGSQQRMSLSALRKIGSTPVSRPVSMASGGGGGGGSSRTPLPALTLPGEDERREDTPPGPAAEAAESSAASPLAPEPRKRKGSDGGQEDREDHDQFLSSFEMQIQVPDVSVSAAPEAESENNINKNKQQQQQQQDSSSGINIEIPSLTVSSVSRGATPLPATAGGSNARSAHTRTPLPVQAPTPLPGSAIADATAAAKAAAESNGSPSASNTHLSPAGSPQAGSFSSTQTPLPDDAGATFTEHFAMASSLEELAHRQLDVMRGRFKNFSHDVQDQVDRIVKKSATDREEMGGGTGGAAAAKATITQDGQPIAGGNQLKDLLVIDSSEGRRLHPEPMDGYQDADVLLNVLREKKPLEMHRAMGIGGKTSIFGVLAPSSGLQERWKRKQEEEEKARIVANAESMDIVVPRREEAGIAFAAPQLTQLRGRKIPKVNLEESVNSGDAAASAE